MKKLLLVVVLVFGFVGSLSARNYVPYGYSLQELHYGFEIYKKDDIYASIIDLKKVNLKFGLVKKEGNYFKKYSINYWWNNYATNNTYAMFNGQFFNISKNPTSLSFPLRSNYKNINTYRDPGILKTLKIYNNGKSVKILNDYYSYYMNGSKELIVGLNPYEDKGKNVSQGRFYIGKLSNNKILFLLAKSKTQYEMETELYLWNIDIDTDVIMMDGSGSTQMKTKYINFYGATSWFGYVDKRKLPNILLVESK